MFVELTMCVAHVIHLLPIFNYKTINGVKLGGPESPDAGRVIQDFR